MSDTHPRNPMQARAAEPVAVGTRSGAVKVPSRDEQRLEPGADPDAVVDKILALLDESRFQTARRMAAEALVRFPEHARVKRCWAIFDNRGKARVAPGGPEPSTH
ncbi:MAG: hypothetical protein GY856_54190, partial [bacterium]|nr:hypothetical protein [bacterium]